MSDDYDYYDLGTYRRPITTGSEEAQRWFDRGLAWTYGYHTRRRSRAIDGRSTPIRCASWFRSATDRPD